jgi:hypothetical protein
VRHIWEKSVCTELRSATGSFGTCHPAGGDARSRELMMLPGVRLMLQGACREMGALARANVYGTQDYGKGRLRKGDLSPRQTVHELRQY